MDEQAKQAAAMQPYQAGGILKAALPHGNTNIIAAIQAVMNDVTYVQKGGTNAFHGYKYATEADTIAALRPAMLKHGLIMVPSLTGNSKLDESGNTHIVMRYTLYHTSGEWLVIDIPASGNDRSNKGTVGDKGVYKAMTGAMKYALRQLFMLETGDDPERDDGRENAKPGAQDQQRTASLLAIADSLVEGAKISATTETLSTLWQSAFNNIEVLKKEHPELFVRVRDAFSARKKVLEEGITR